MHLFRIREMARVTLHLASDWQVRPSEEDPFFCKLKYSEWVCCTFLGTPDQTPMDQLQNLFSPALLVDNQKHPWIPPPPRRDRPLTSTGTSLWIKGWCSQGAGGGETAAASMSCSTFDSPQGCVPGKSTQEVTEGLLCPKARHSSSPSGMKTAGAFTSDCMSTYNFFFQILKEIKGLPDSLH